MQTRAGTGTFLRLGHQSADRSCQSVTPANEGNPYVFFYAFLYLCLKIFLEQTHQRRNLVKRSLPVVGRERIQSQCVDPQTWRGGNRPTHRVRALSVTSQPRQTSGSCPSAITVHDDS